MVRFTNHHKKFTHLTYNGALVGSILTYSFFDVFLDGTAHVLQNRRSGYFSLSREF